MNEEIKKYIDEQYRFILDSLRGKHMAIDKSLHELQNKINIGREYTLLLVQEEAEKVIKKIMEKEETLFEKRMSRIVERVEEMESLNESFKKFKDEFKQAKKFFDKISEAYSDFGGKFCEDDHY